ncbi:DUF7619 domain-containing protein [Sanyastnella coralliicola]|uniref:DUF7619 domain-containing protein n=1 Tax=Sanyastnella coralliicola TaxID=3069118 RepID=UPI0027BA87A8|nr:T9SS type A sorting domain-containing protein [Longitalea sp. SCSIO 12813]
MKRLSTLLLVLCFAIPGFSQSIESIVANSGAPGETLEVTITGIGTNFPDYLFASESGLWAGIGQTSSTSWPISNLEYISETVATGTLEIPADAEQGVYDLHVAYTGYVNGGWPWEDEWGPWEELELSESFCIGCENLGCSDPDANNYDPEAEWNNGTCEYNIQGYVWYDDNENGLYTAGEQFLSFQNVILNPGNITAITNDEGQYIFQGVTPGNYTVEVVTTELFPFYTLPSNPVNVFVSPSGNVPDVNLGLSDDLPQFAICVDFYPPGVGYPCNDWVNHNICFRNMGNQTIDGYVAVDINPLIQDYMEVTPIDSVVGNTVYMGFEDLAPGHMFLYDIEFLTPSVDFIGEFITSTATAVGFFQGAQVAMGVEELTVEMTCAYDPNDKQVFPNGYAEPHYVLPETELEYLVRFQNTGNAPATNVTITDTISEYLDLTTFQLMANSHSVMVQIDPTTRQVDFVFENIMLPDSNCCEPESHGLVSYTILPFAGLEPETEINNTAYIFFDNNPPIVTNTTWTTIYDCNNGLASFEMSAEAACEGVPIDFLNEQEYVEEYLWSIDGENMGIEDLVSLTLEPGEYEIDHTATNPLCTATQSETVEVYETPEANAGVDQEICAGSTTELEASGGFLYDWDGLGQGATQEVSPEETTTYTVTVVSMDGCSDTDEVEVAIVEGPEADAGLDQEICEGESADLSASGGNAYDWTDLGEGADQTVSPTETTVYVVTVTGGNGCSSTDEVEVLVNPAPLANAGDDDAICIGESIELTASGGESYNWETLGEGATQEVSPEETTTYVVTVLGSNGCSASDMVEIIVNELPHIEAGADVDICPGDMVDLTATGGETYVWLNEGEGAVIQVLPEETTTYVVTGTDANGCTNTDAIEVVVNSLPEADAGEDQTICAGETIELTASGGVEYVWVDVAEGATVEVSPTETTTYVVSVFSAEGCSDFDLVDVIVNALPEANAGMDQVICVGETANLMASGGDSYDWTDLGEGAGQDVSPEETTTYVVTVTNGEGCSDTDEVEVLVNPLPEANAGMDQAICEGETANLMASGGESYEWENLGSGAGQEVTPDETTVYVVTVEDANGCSDSDEVEVTVNPLPTAEITENGPELTASAGDSYQWYINGTPIDGATDQSYTAETTGNYSVEVTNIYGCSTISEEMDVIIISVEEQEVAILTYPNPTHDILYIQVEAGWTYEMNLFDASGRIVAQQSNIVDSLYELDCTQFGTGTYKLVLRNGDQRITKTIIVK